MDTGRPPKKPLVFNSFPFPRENSATYAIDLFEDLSVVVLNSNHTQSVESQTEFLESALKKRQNNKHLFALYHFPAYGIVKGGLSIQSVKV